MVTVALVVMSRCYDGDDENYNNMLVCSSHFVKTQGNQMRERRSRELTCTRLSVRAVVRLPRSVWKTTRNAYGVTTYQ